MQYPRQLLFVMAILVCRPSLGGALEPLYFGFYPYVSPTKLIEFHHPIQSYLTRSLQMNVSMVTAPDPERFILRTHQNKYDLVFTPPHLGRLAQIRDGYIPIARTMHQIKGVFLVPTKSEISGMEQIRGHSIMMASSSGITFQMAIQQFHALGFIPGLDVNIIETSTLNNAMYAPLRGEADIAMTGVNIWATAPDHVKQRLRVIGETHTAPGFLVLAHPTMSIKLQQKIKHALFAFLGSREAQTDLIGRKFKGFGPAQEEDLAALDIYIEKFVSQSN